MVFVPSLLLAIVVAADALPEGFSIGNRDVRWRLDCDMVGPDIASKQGPGESCGGYCVDNGACQTFTWTDFNGGTCWMKGSNWKFQAGLSGAVCGYVSGRVSDTDPRLPGGSNGGGGGSIKGTYWSEQSDSGGCQMPGNANYAVTDAIALGQQPELGNLVWRSGLCGQVLTIDCGHGAVDAVVASTCNLNSPSCGVDMIGKTWRKVTNNMSPGITKCSARLSTRNPIQGGSPLCFRRPFSESANLYYAAIGVLNTNGRVSSSATLAGVQGSRGNDGWFQFNSGGLFSGNAAVSFRFEDGSTANFKLSDCAVGGNTHIFQ